MKSGEHLYIPENFVVIVSEQPDDKNPKHESKAKPSEISTPKTNPVTSSQRKSLEEKSGKSEADGISKVTPPVPSKKPIFPFKKSPSASEPPGRLLASLRKKITDVVDGASGSKSQPVLIKANEIKDDSKQEVVSDNAFDQVERTPMLSDVRATRAKAPGRRPPSVVFKEGEPGIVNGNTDHVPLDSLKEHLPNSRSYVINHEETENEVKPKIREWEKHKAPWLEEMKLNQAKRTSTSPGPEQQKLKLTPSEKSVSPEVDEGKSTKVSPFEKHIPSSIDMSKSVPSVNNKLKTPPNELEKGSAILKPKPIQPVTQSTSRPQSIHSVAVTDLNDVQSQKQFTTNHLIPVTTATVTPKTSPATNHINKISPGIKLPAFEKSQESSNEVQESITMKQYMELLQRIEKLESLMETQHQLHKAAIEELKSKLQIETDMRRLLQAELDKVSQCVMQV